MPVFVPMVDASQFIAIVDDDPSVLRALRRTLRVRAFQARTYGSAYEFLAALPDGLPECLIVDLQMPDMTGLELLAYLKHRDIQIPAIVITAYEDSTVHDRSEAAGAVALLLKPLHNTSLFAAIEKACRGKVPRDRNHESS